MRIVRDMSCRPTRDNDTKGANRASVVGIRGKAASSGSCSFCWFVLSLHPTLTGLTENDSVIFKAHLERTHGLVPEIQR